MRRHEIELLEDDLSADDSLPTTWELGLSIDLASAELEDETDDELGLRSLYEHPEALLDCTV